MSPYLMYILYSKKNILIDESLKLILILKIFNLLKLIHIFIKKFKFNGWKSQLTTNTHVIVNKVHIIKCRGYKV